MGHLFEERAAIEMLERDLPRPEADYVSLLSQVLFDRRLTREERDSVDASARQNGLTSSDRRRLHIEFLKHVSLSALANGEIADAQLQDLNRLSQLLGLKADAVSDAISDARNSAEQLGTLLIDISAVQNEKEPLSISRILSSAASAGSRIIDPLKMGAGAVATAISVMRSQKDIHCESCKAVTAHRIRSLDDFPVKEWLLVAWQAKTLSIPGFVLNAATIVIAEQQLLLRTGKSILPKFSCSKCNQTCDKWEAARILLQSSLPKP